MRRGLLNSCVGILCAIGVFYVYPIYAAQKTRTPKKGTSLPVLRAPLMPMETRLTKDTKKDAIRKWLLSISLLEIIGGGSIVIIGYMRKKKK